VKGKFSAYLVISCFEKLRPKQNSVGRLKSNILAHPKYFPQKNFGLATPLAASERHYTAAGGEIQVLCGGIHE